MDPNKVLLQYDQQTYFSTYGSRHFNHNKNSAFKIYNHLPKDEQHYQTNFKCKDQDYSYDQIDDSFTLGSVDMSSFSDIQQGKADLTGKQMSNPIVITSKVAKGCKAQVICRNMCIYSNLISQQYNPSKRLSFMRVHSNIIQIQIIPLIKQKTSSTKHSPTAKQQQSASLQSQGYGQIEQSQSSQIKYQSKQSKKSNKKVKINQKSRNRKSNRRLKEQYSVKHELLEDQFVEGVLRNCKCCGKFITQLCFKCPHIYCNADNCPRKKKKLLNQRMLERMKQQKIQSHFKQRQLYQKMRNQKNLSTPSSNSITRKLSRTMLKKDPQSQQQILTSFQSTSLQQTQDIKLEEVAQVKKTDHLRNRLNKKTLELYFGDDDQ